MTGEKHQTILNQVWTSEHKLQKVNNYRTRKPANFNQPENNLSSHIKKIFQKWKVSVMELNVSCALNRTCCRSDVTVVGSRTASRWHGDFSRRGADVDQIGCAA